MTEPAQYGSQISAIPKNLIVMHGDKYSWSLRVWGGATGELWDHCKQDYIQKSELPEPLLKAHDNLWELSGDDYLVEYQGNYYYMMDHIYNESAARSLGVDSWNGLYDVVLQNAIKAAMHDALKNAIVLVAKKSVALGAMHVVSVLVNAEASKESVDQIRQVLSDCMFEMPEKDSMVSLDLQLQCATTRVVESRSADNVPVKEIVDIEQNTENKTTRPYRRKHFYKVTCVRSEELLANSPWLKYQERDFCMIGYCQPTPQEAVSFIGNPIYDRLYDSAISVQEISKEEALRDFNMDNWSNQKVFGADKLAEQKNFLENRIRNAEIHAQGLRSDDRPTTKEPLR